MTYFNTDSESNANSNSGSGSCFSPVPADPVTLKFDELEFLNGSFIDAGIKWLAMFKGVWAEVLYVEEGELTLKITYPERMKAVPAGDGEQILRILIRCRAFTYTDTIAAVHLLEYKDHGAAGCITGIDVPSVPPAEFRPSFGDTGQLLHIRRYSRKEFLRVAEETKTGGGHPSGPKVR